MKSELATVRAWLLVFIIGLVISGATAIPLETELNLLGKLAGVETIGSPGVSPQLGISGWIGRVRDGLVETYAKFPFIAYGTDWLAFAHFVIAIAFIGPWRDPVRNVWVVEFGLIACVLVIPFALVMGGVRGIPLTWRFIDCSFGVFGFVPLWMIRRIIVNHEANKNKK